MNQIIEWSEIESLTRGKRGKVLKIVCPSCVGRRTNKKDPALSVNLDKGVAKCHYCDAISFRKQHTIETRPYKLPKQDWKNYTDISDQVVKWIETTRKISQKTLTDLGITEEKYYQPQLKKEVQNIVFNYFELNQVVNKKYRTGKKHFTQTTNGKSIFYNINSVIDQEEAYIVEGEFDVLAMHECGYKNTISLPNGANDNDEVWINCKQYLDTLKKFYICTDNDEQGNIVAEKIAQRLGNYRCVRVEFKHKDANGQLINSGKPSVVDAIDNARHFKTQGTFAVDDLYDDIMELYDKGLPDTIYPKHNSFGNLKNIFSVMRGQLVITTGIPSHGKSNFIEWYVMNLINDHDMKASFFSPEHHPLALHQSIFMEKYIGKSFWKSENSHRMNKSEMNQYKEWANEKLYLTSAEDGKNPNWDWLLEKFKEQVFVYGVDIFVIDAFNKLEYNNKNQNELQSIREVLTKLTIFAQLNNVIVFLIAHPRKMTRDANGIYQMPGLYDISGSSDFRNICHCGAVVYRHFQSIHNSVTGQDIEKDQVEFKTQKVKFKYQGEIGQSVVFKFDIASGRYYVGDYVPKGILSNLSETPTYNEIIHKPKPTIYTDQEEDLPF
tara:strand:+ start:8539 stop:10362 length:1824 start_codon:yes stop_codon:yes gene_type:complete